VAGDLVAIHLRHLHVEQHDRELAAQELAQRRVAGAHAHDIAIQVTEQRFERDQVALDIVDD
jgi:hypothetical protein